MSTPLTWDADRPSPLQAPPQTARFQEKRDTLLAAAARLFNVQGVKGATLSDIAASVGLVTTSLTYYYRKKEDLATACFLRAIVAHESLALAAAAEPTVAARVARFFSLHADLLAAIERGEQPPLMVFADIRALPDAQAATVFAAYTDMFRRVRALLAGPETAALDRDDLNARAHLMLSAAHWVRAWIDRHEVDDYPRVARRVTDLLLNGLASPQADWPGDEVLGVLNAKPMPAGEGTDDTADAFLRAATELVNEQGYRGASVDRISARLNVTKGSFYHHNETKLDLIAACFERSFAVLRHTLRAAEQAGGPGWQRACAALCSLLRFQLGEQGPLLRSTAISALPDDAHRAQVRHTLQRLTERIASVLVDGLEDGSIRPLDTAIAAQLLSSAINAAAELQRWVPGITPDNVTRRYGRPALLGLLCCA
ncbi:MAG: TetR family transcriptional regulator [Burkholderiales bacterium PBB5]|nr:MAG: TetR family transcriptional regulator [Burkholderiales bacterium PBB5]